MARIQLCGASEIEDALSRGTEPALVLVCEPPYAGRLAALLDRLAALNVEIRVESGRELRRMASRETTPETAPEILGMVHGAPARRGEGELVSLMSSGGIVFVLAGLRYPANVGFILRSVEVAGGAGIVIDADWGEEPFAEALRIGMHADRFYPVVRGTAVEAVAVARAAGRRVVAVETSGKATPWETDLSGPCVVVVGSETMGIDPDVLQSADAVVRIPVGGFIPSYNVQAAVGIMLGEWMRQSSIP